MVYPPVDSEPEPEPEIIAPPQQKEEWRRPSLTVEKFENPSKYENLLPLII